MDTVEITPERAAYNDAMRRCAGPGNGGLTVVEGGVGAEAAVQVAFTALVNSGQAMKLKRKYRVGLRRKQVR
jgi:hypothetical protein